MSDNSSLLKNTDAFVDRHIGPRSDDIESMLATLDLESLDALISEAVPSGIRLGRELEMGAASSESEVLARLRTLAEKNRVFRSYLGLGYHDTIVPPVIQRNVLENPGWYTQYTPYQSEISQGRLEALLNFQTMIIELTGLEIANSSLLDESTAAAEAMTLAWRVRPKKNRANAIFVSEQCHPQTIAVVKTRAIPLGLEVIVGDHEAFDFTTPVFAVMVAYPATDGRVNDYRGFAAQAHEQDAQVIAVADLMSLVVLTPPGAWGADVCVGNSQRFGVPLGFGGPHAGFFAAREAHVRKMAGRIVGVARDSHDRPAFRLALATREQHIRREKATSNICTAQVLLAIMAGTYGVYHGPDGLKRIARRIHRSARVLARGLDRLGHDTGDHVFFDTLRVQVGSRRDEILRAARDAGINLRPLDETTIVVALDETVTERDLDDLFQVFAPDQGVAFSAAALAAEVDDTIPEPFARTSPPVKHAIFSQFHSETDLLRYLHRLQAKDLSLTTSMIPLGSCTMKLNATAELMPITWPEFGRIHPFAPLEQARGYLELFEELEAMLKEITGFAAISFQPNAGAQGEYAGLLVIRAYHHARGDTHRNVCIIPESAHGTNPASAALAGMEIVVVRCDAHGNIDVDDLRAKAERHRDALSALMVTYPSTHGVFEDSILEVCEIIHRNGGQVYMDGANLNAQVGVCRPGDFGADVCHLNLHKTFAIPHGGGGPGMGPIGVAEHLRPFLPGHPLAPCGGEQAIGPVSAAPWGSASILPISYAYIAMLGTAGLKKTTQMAILNANYMAKRLEAHFPVLYKGPGGFVAHEFILDTRDLKDKVGIRVEDIAKRLMDYGFHAPTISFPVPGTLMIEPTESEPKDELDRLCDALIAIRGEIAAIEKGEADPENNVVRRAPHTAEEVVADAWDRPYSREQAAFPAPWTRAHKYWPPVSRIDNVYGDRNFVGCCPPPDAFRND
jgi:glycine dehydrogenase